MSGSAARPGASRRPVLKQTGTRLPAPGRPSQVTPAYSPPDTAPAAPACSAPAARLHLEQVGEVHGVEHQLVHGRRVRQVGIDVAVRADLLPAVSPAELVIVSGNQGRD